MKVETHSKQIQNAKSLEIWRAMYSEITDYNSLSFAQWSYNLRGFWTDNAGLNVTEGAD